MNLYKKVFGGLLAGAMVASLVGCGASGGNTSSGSLPADNGSGESAVEAIQQAGKITMVTHAEFAPFEFKDGDEIIGIDAEIAAAIAEELGVELEITDIAFDSCIPSVTQGRADFAAAGMTVTEDRLKNVDFTDTYFTAAQSIIVPIDSDIAALEDLDTLKVGVQLGTTGDVFCTDEGGELDIEMNVERFPKGVDVVSALIAGKLDAVIIDNYPAKKLVASNSDKVKILEGVTVTDQEEYAMAVAKGSDLVQKINEILATMKQDGRFDEIVSKYI